MDTKHADENVSFVDAWEEQPRIVLCWARHVEVGMSPGPIVPKRCPKERVVEGVNLIIGPMEPLKPIGKAREQDLPCRACCLGFRALIGIPPRS